MVHIATNIHIDGLCTIIVIPYGVFYVLFHHNMYMHHMMPTNVYSMDGVPYTTMV